MATIKELAEQAGMHYREICDEFCAANTDGVPFEMMERFAELIRQDAREQQHKHYEKAIGIAIDAEREVNKELMKAIVKGLDLSFDNEIVWFEWRNSAEVALSKATGESNES